MVRSLIYALAVITLVSCKPEPVVLGKINSFELMVYPFDMLAPLDSKTVTKLVESNNLTGWNDLEHLLMDDYPDGNWESLYDRKKQAFRNTFISQREFYEFPFMAGTSQYSFILIRFIGELDEESNDIRVYSKPRANDNELILIAQYTNYLSITEFTEVTNCQFFDNGRIFTQTITDFCSDVLLEDDKITCYSDTLEVTYRTNKDGDFKEFKRRDISSSFKL
jgi:hypothetical protein